MDEGRLGSLYLRDPGAGRLRGNGDWELDYLSFTSKHLRLEMPNGQVIPRGRASTATLQLWWKQCEGDWQELTTVEETITATTIEATFDHPEPDRAGSYQLKVAMSAGRSESEVLTILSMEREDLVRAGLAAQGYVPPVPEKTPVQPAPPSADVQDVLELIPEMTGFSYVGRPDRPDLAPRAVYELSEDHRVLYAADSKDQDPDQRKPYPNEDCPETETLTAIGRDGRELTYTYHVDGDGRRYFMTSHLRHLQKAHAVSRTAAIAKTDPLGAARLLHRFTEVYSGYVPTTDEAWYNFLLNYPSGYPYNYWGGVWNRWHLSDLSSLSPLLAAYADVKQTDALQLVSEEVGFDVEQRLIEEVFLPSADYLFSYPVTLANMDFAIWRGLIAMGESLDDPDFVHRAVTWIQDYVTKRHLSDGAWFEVALSYHTQSTNGLRNAMTSLAGYTDPDGYLSPRSGVRFDDLDLASNYPILQRAQHIAQLLAYPDGNLLPVKDTWGNASVSTPDLAAGSFVLPSAGIVRLAQGDDAAQEQLYVQFTPKYGHNHFDALSLAFYARGQELLPDLGYTHSKRRYFAISTLGHNTVVVDSSDTEMGGDALHGGTIEEFTSTGPIQITRAGYTAAYPITEEYSREPWLIPFSTDGNHGYVLDVFRVAGGSRHEYTLNGDANRDAYLFTDDPLTDYGERLLPPGVHVVEGEDQHDPGSAEGHYPGYIYVKDVQQAELSGQEYDLTMMTFDANGDRARLGIIGVLNGDDELFLGRAPSLRTTRMSGTAGDSNDQVVLYDMPKLVHRRDGSNLSSTFITMLEPYEAGAGRQVEAVDRLTPDAAPAQSMVAQIAHGGTVDMVLSNPRHREEPVQVGNVTMRGELGFVRVVDGMITELLLVAGSELTVGDLTLDGAGTVTGAIVATRQVAAGDAINGLVVDTEVPTEAVGHHVVVTHPDGSTKAFRIGEIQSVGGEQVVVLADQDPGFVINSDGTSGQTYYPAKQWAVGEPHKFRIGMVARWEGTPAPVGLATGGLSGTVTGPDGEVLAGATLVVTGYPHVSVTSADDGSFTLTEVPVGVRRVTASLDGYERAVSDAVDLIDGQTATVTVQIIKATPPELTEVSSLLAAGDPATVTASTASDIYVVPTGTIPVAAEIKAAAASDGLVMEDLAAGQPAEIDTTALGAGVFRIYAIDAADSVSSGAGLILIPKDLDVVGDDSEFARYQGAWRGFSNTNYLGGTVQRGQSAGATVEIPFYGSGFTVVATTAVDNGFIEIYLDDELLGTVDTFSATAQWQQEVFSSPAAAEGAHMVRIVNTGEKREGARNAYFTFDGLLIS